MKETNGRCHKTAHRDLERLTKPARPHPARPGGESDWPASPVPFGNASSVEKEISRTKYGMSRPKLSKLRIEIQCCESETKFHFTSKRSKRVPFSAWGGRSSQRTTHEVAHPQFRSRHAVPRPRHRLLDRGLLRKRSCLAGQSDSPPGRALSFRISVGT